MHITSIDEETHATGLFDKAEENVSPRVRWLVGHLKIEILEKTYEAERFSLMM